MQNLGRGVASLLLLGVWVAAAGAGCSDDGEAVPEGGLEALGNSARTNSGINTKMRFTIRDSDAWEELWSLVHQNADQKPSVPDVDFDQQEVIVATMGQTPDSLYETRIETVTVENGAASVVVKELTPGQGCISSPATATPLDMYVAPRFAGEPTYTETTFTIRCAN